MEAEVNKTHSKDIEDVSTFIDDHVKSVNSFNGNPSNLIEKRKDTSSATSNSDDIPTGNLEGSELSGGDCAKHTKTLPEWSNEDDSECDTVVISDESTKSVTFRSPPKIVIDAAADTNLSPVKDEEDLEPLLTVDDTESQSSDAVSDQDTVSYDIMQNYGAEDDDEKSIETTSTTSYDMKFDSPQRRTSSRASNSSMVTSLLDNSAKETSTPTSPVAQGSSNSSCMSSPSGRTGSTAVEDSLSEENNDILRVTIEENVPKEDLLIDSNAVIEESFVKNECLVTSNEIRVPTRSDPQDKNIHSVEKESCNITESNSPGENVAEPDDSDVKSTTVKTEDFPVVGACLITNEISKSISKTASQDHSLEEELCKTEESSSPVENVANDDLSIDSAPVIATEETHVGNVFQVTSNEKFVDQSTTENDLQNEDIRSLEEESCINTESEENSDLQICEPNENFQVNDSLCPKDAVTPQEEFYTEVGKCLKSKIDDLANALVSEIIQLALEKVKSLSLTRIEKGGSEAVKTDIMGTVKDDGKSSADLENFSLSSLEPAVSDVGINLNGEECNKDIEGSPEGDTMGSQSIPFKSHFEDSSVSETSGICTLEEDISRPESAHENKLNESIVATNSESNNESSDSSLMQPIQNEEELPVESHSKTRPCLLEKEFPQIEEEELGTPCGEMLAEHFMDIESGRNASVFLSMPEDNPLSAYDRVVNTIGTHEVDSDTGKSVSVFRSENEVFYEIQRASTCTSVFESVEEEDEDMIDTTASFEDHDKDESELSVNISDNLEDQSICSSDRACDKDCDAFEDAVDAFLEKERVAQTEQKCVSNGMDPTQDECQPDSSILRKRRLNEAEEKSSQDSCEEDNICKTVSVYRRGHSEAQLSDSEEKRKMAERWASGGESQVPDTPEMREKQRAIREVLDSGVNVRERLCQLALTEGGLINDALRKDAWPRMLDLDPNLDISAPPLEELKRHPEYGLVVLDVARSLKRFPPDIPPDQRETLQDKLTRLIMYVITKNRHLQYYQGYHDVAVTFLLVVGESVAFQIMERLSTEHLFDCMQPTMDKTSYLLHYIYPLIHRLHPTLAEYLERSEVGTMFCLPWFITWFGHNLNRYQDVVRLYDHFLASPPLAPLYLAAVLVAHRAEEVLAVDCDMAAIHALLSRIPDTLPLEILLKDATDLYQKYPPESIANEVEERVKREQEMRAHEVVHRDRRRRQLALQRVQGSQDSAMWQMAEFQHRMQPVALLFNRWLPQWQPMRVFLASAFFFGVYFYGKDHIMPNNF